MPRDAELTSVTGLFVVVSIVVITYTASLKSDELFVSFGECRTSRRFYRGIHIPVARYCDVMEFCTVNAAEPKSQACLSCCVR